MSLIQVTDEITEQLTRLQATTAESVGFSRASNLAFEDNQNFSALVEYRNIIRTIGTLSNRYKEVLEGDIRACEQTVENMRSLDEQAGKAMKG